MPRAGSRLQSKLRSLGRQCHAQWRDRCARSRALKAARVPRRLGGDFSPANFLNKSRQPPGELAEVIWMSCSRGVGVKKRGWGPRIGWGLFVSRRWKARPLGMSAAAEAKTNATRSGFLTAFIEDGFLAGLPWRAQTAADHGVGPSRWTFATRRMLIDAACALRRVCHIREPSDHLEAKRKTTSITATHSHACLYVETHHVTRGLIRVYLCKTQS